MDLKRCGLIGICTLLCVLAIGLVIGNYIDKSGNQANLKEYGGDLQTEYEDTTEITTIVAYITGEVNSPGVYSMDENARLLDLVEEAGGFTENAYLDNLNLAERIEDGEKIVVENINDIVDKESNLGENNNEGEQGLININTADADELKQLEGIGEGLAKAIIAYREETGDFTSTEEIREVDGIGQGIYERIKDRITVK